NIAIFVVYFFTERTEFGEAMTAWFGLIPQRVVGSFYFWQLATYLFLHGGIGHILFNMLALWFFGADLERTWGTDRFLQFYFFCGIGAGLCVVVGNYLFGNPAIPTIGCSGAIYGILMACAILFPDRLVLIAFLFPIKMKWFVAIFGAIAFLNTFKSINSGVSDVAHLGGLVFGYIFLQMPAVRGFHPVDGLNAWYRNWKIQRAKKKFQVYLRKNRSDSPTGRDDDRWVN
ncbi:MAG: rhomboid family intramembrane serine protease, partial [Bryobacteraceae bacterium]